MATFTASCSSSSSSWTLSKHSHRLRTCYSYPISKCSPFGPKTKLLSSLCCSKNSKRLNFYVRAENKEEPSSSSVAVAHEEAQNEEIAKKDLHLEGELQKESGSETESKEMEREKQQEMDWKTDEEFKNFMGNPSIEAAIKLEKKRADRRLKELDRQTSSNPFVSLLNRLLRDSLSREKEMLEKAEESFKALDLNKVINLLLKWYYDHFLG